MISSKCHYALKAMLELAQHEGQGPLTINEIAQAQRIPARFLEAILRQLKQAGYTDSVRGKDGGYFLTRHADAITVGDVIRLFEGPLVAPNTNVKQQREDVFNQVWEKAETALSSVYDSIHFEELAREHNRYVMNYSI